MPLRGCEAAYLFPTDIDVCLSGQTDEGNEFVDRERRDVAEARFERRDDQAPGDEGNDDGRDGRDGGDAIARLRGGRGIIRAGNTLGAGHENGQGEDELEVEGGKEEWERKEEEVEGNLRKEEEIAGNLVIHVRSGDIFAGARGFSYGQVSPRFNVPYAVWR